VCELSLRGNVALHANGRCRQEKGSFYQTTGPYPLVHVEISNKRGDGEEEEMHRRVKCGCKGGIEKRKGGKVQVWGKKEGGENAGYPVSEERKKHRKFFRTGQATIARNRAELVGGKNLLNSDDEDKRQLGGTP